MAHNLKLGVIAEGVETAEQLGVRELRGWLQEFRKAPAFGSRFASAWNGEERIFEFDDGGDSDPRCQGPFGRLQFGWHW